MSSWLCTCGAHNAKGSRVCEGCGADRPAPPSVERPEPERRRCPHVADPDDLCATCAASIRQAQEKFKQHMATLAERNERAKTGVEIESAKRAASHVRQVFAPTCAGCVSLIEDPGHRVYEDARLWHRVCWERERARMKRERTQERKRGRVHVR